VTDPVRSSFAELGPHSFPIGENGLMIKVVQQVIVDGYASGKTDFSEALSALPIDRRGEYDLVIDAAASAVERPDVSCVLSVAGHSDRVDTAGVDRHAARAQELQSSKDRAESAGLFITAEIRSRVPGLPEDLNELQNFALLVRWAGAGLLQHATPNLTEAQRKQNRRVQLRAIAFVP
jgi:hypothetical protein